MSVIISVNKSKQIYIYIGGLLARHRVTNRRRPVARLWVLAATARSNDRVDGFGARGWKTIQPVQTRTGPNDRTAIACRKIGDGLAVWDSHTRVPLRRQSHDVRTRNFPGYDNKMIGRTTWTHCAIDELQRGRAENEPKMLRRPRPVPETHSTDGVSRSNSYCLFAPF